MALIKNQYIKKLNITLTDCYWKIEEENGIVGGKSKIRVRMNCFRNKKNADHNKDKIGDFDFEFKPNLSQNADNIIKQAYDYAKTLPEFKNAKDA
jgi:hypothetical protein